MTFNPLEIRRFKSAGKSDLLATPLEAHGSDILEHVKALVDNALSSQKGFQADNIRNSLKIELMAATVPYQSYEEQLSNTVAKVLSRLKTFLYGDSFRGGIEGPPYAKVVFEDVELLVARELEELKQNTLKVTRAAYRIQELFVSFTDIYAGHSLSSHILYRTKQLTDDPNRADVLLLASFRDAVFTEVTYEAMESFLALMVTGSLLSNQERAENLKREAQLLREELEVEYLWEKLTKD